MTIIQTIGKIPGAESIFRILFKNQYAKYIKRKNERKHAIYQQYGLEAIEQFAKCMNENGFHYTLAFGSILGAIREHGFIKHDLDIDTYLWIDEYKPRIREYLKAYGFDMVYEFSIDNDKYGKEETYIYKGCRIDVFYLYPAIDEHPYCCEFIEHVKWGKIYRVPRRVEVPITRERRLVPFESIELYIPANAEEICEYRYGPHYMTPDPTWNWVAEKSAIKDWPEMTKLTTCRRYQ